MFAPSEAAANINWALSPPPSTRSLSLQGGIKDREVAEPSVHHRHESNQSNLALIRIVGAYLLHREKFETNEEK